MIIQIANVTVKEGEIAELKCVATGLPTPSVVWKRDGAEYEQTVSVSSNHVLHFTYELLA